jgi:hypothetical protein
MTRDRVDTQRFPNERANSSGPNMSRAARMAAASMVRPNAGDIGARVRVRRI